MANFGDSNRIRLRYATEATFGVAPVGPAMNEVRLTSESLSHTKATVLSNELRSDRMRQDVTEVGAGASGDISFELSHGSFDGLIEGLLQGTFVTTSTTVNAVFTSTTVNVGSATAAALEVGQFFRISGAGSNNGVYRVNSIAGAVVTVDAGSFAVATTVASTVVRGKTAKNGVTSRSYSLEREYSDLGLFFQAVGMKPNTLNLTVQARSIVTGQMGFMGAQGNYASTTLASTSIAAPTTDVLNATKNVGVIYEGGYSTGLTTAIRQITMQYTNNLREQEAVGSRVPVGIGSGSVEISGQIDAYFNSVTLANKFISHQATSLAFSFKDAAGNVNYISMPKIYFSDGNAVATGINADVMLPLQYMAARDPSLGYMIRWDVLDA